MSKSRGQLTPLAISLENRALLARLRETWKLINKPSTPRIEKVIKVKQYSIHIKTFILKKAIT